MLRRKMAKKPCTKEVLDQADVSLVLMRWSVGKAARRQQQIDLQPVMYYVNFFVAQDAFGNLFKGLSKLVDGV